MLPPTVGVLRRFRRNIPHRFTGTRVDVRRRTASCVVARFAALRLNEPVGYSPVCVCLSDLPGAPSVPEVSDVTADSCRLAWSPPRSDGGTPVTGYIVERRTDVGGRWIPLKVKPVSGEELDVTDLFEGQKYEFRVIAENKVGAGKPGEPSAPIVAKSPFSKYRRRLYAACEVSVQVNMINLMN